MFQTLKELVINFFRLKSVNIGIQIVQVGILGCLWSFIGNITKTLQNNVNTFVVSKLFG